MISVTSEDHLVPNSHLDVLIFEVTLGCSQVKRDVVRRRVPCVSKEQILVSGL